jgi:hypothetical protein
VHSSDDDPYRLRPAAVKLRKDIETWWASQSDESLRSTLEVDFLSVQLFALLAWFSTEKTRRHNRLAINMYGWHGEKYTVELSAMIDALKAAGLLRRGYLGVGTVLDPRFFEPVIEAEIALFSDHWKLAESQTRAKPAFPALVTPRERQRRKPRTLSRFFAWLLAGRERIEDEISEFPDPAIDSASNDLNLIYNILGPPPEKLNSRRTRNPEHPVGVS